MFKNKFLSVSFIAALTFSQIGFTNVYAGEGTTIISDWDNIIIEDFKDEASISPDYFPEDNERWGGVGGPGNNTSSDNNSSNNKPLDDVIITNSYKLKNNVCYVTTTSNVNGKTTTEEKTTDLYNCMNSGASINGSDSSRGNDVGSLDLDKVQIVGQAPGKVNNIDDLSSVVGEELADTTRSDFEIVRDDKGNVTHLLYKPTGQKFKVGEKIILNGRTLGLVNDDGTIDASYNDKIQGGLSTNVQNDLEGLGEGTHALYLTTDKTKEDPTFIPLNIIVNEDATISKADFDKAMEKTIDEINGKIIKDTARTAYYIEGKLILSTVNDAEFVSVTEFQLLFETVKTMIVVKPIN